MQHEPEERSTSSLQMVLSELMRLREQQRINKQTLMLLVAEQQFMFDKFSLVLQDVTQLLEKDV
jgi:hypothetical protein